MKSLGSMTRVVALFGALALTLACESSGSSSSSGDSTDAADATDGADASDTSDATDGSDATDTTDATDGSDVSDVTDSTDATDGADVTDGSDVTDATDGADVTDGSDVSDGSDASDGSDMNDGSDGAEGLDTHDGTDASDGSDGSDGTDGGGTFCGGFAGIKCGGGEFCDYSLDAQCGAGDMGGTCQPIPQACDADYVPTCGCDGVIYSNPCHANSMGVAVAPKWFCPAPEGEPCGGKGNPQCAEGLFCDFPLEQICGAADGSGLCQKVPEACDLNLDPVCGCNGVTYDNACLANADGVAVADPEWCKGGTIGQSCGGWTGKKCGEGEFCKYDANQLCGAAETPGVCMAVGPTDCPAVTEPVCGCDGMDYDNECLANAAGTSVSFFGTCDDGPPVGSVACGGWLGNTCTKDEYCAYQPGEYCGAADASSVCMPKPEACDDVKMPVCGCDGQTYENECKANAAGTGLVDYGACTM